MINYQILNPNIDTKKPFLNKDGFFIFPVTKKYRYYIECKQTNDILNIDSYFILLSEKKFNENCKLCKIDMYGRCKFKPQGEIKDYIESQCKNRGNIEVIYKDSFPDFDSYLID